MRLRRWPFAGLTHEKGGKLFASFNGPLSITSRLMGTPSG
jgi:hypothetical protein